MTALPTVPDITTGVSDTSKFAQLMAAVNFLMAPPRAELRQATLQSIPNNTWTAITLDTEDADYTPDGANNQHDNVTNNSRFTAVYPGRYAVGGGSALVANATARRGVRYAVNGTAVQAQEALIAATAANGISVPARMKTVFLNIGDYLEIQAFQESGGALNTAPGTGGPHMTVIWVAST